MRAPIQNAPIQPKTTMFYDFQNEPLWYIRQKKSQWLNGLTYRNSQTYTARERNLYSICLCIHTDANIMLSKSLSSISPKTPVTHHASVFLVHCVCSLGFFVFILLRFVLVSPAYPVKYIANKRKSSCSLLVMWPSVCPAPKLHFNFGSLPNYIWTDILFVF